MPKLPVLTGKEFVKFLETIGFFQTRQKGSHIRLHCMDGRVTTIPVHSNKELPKGLLRKIIREDLRLSLEDFIEIYSKRK
jgi:predicted RNA binding protein YcfA (HicA-like mRNA interferase family)